MKTFCLFIYCIIPLFSFSQDIATELAMNVKKIESDEQFKHAVISFYVEESKTGKVLFDKNSLMGLAPASCQKIITSASAFEILGPKFRYTTSISFDQKIKSGVLEGNLFFEGEGDPTLGSERWSATSESMVMKKIAGILKKNNIQSIAGDIIVDDHDFALDPLPGGWVWEDIGNYYGAGVWELNWRENQYDVTFKTGAAESDSTTIIATKPVEVLQSYSFTNFVKTGAKGSGDNGYLFSAPFSKNIIASGTVPLSAEGFTISGSLPNPPNLFLRSVSGYLKKNGIAVAGDSWSYSERRLAFIPTVKPVTFLDTISSPSLDSINYWFLKKSVNLFGEAFVKAIASKNYMKATTDSGISIIRDYWSKKGIDKASLNMVDGSGLSPANRITAYSLVAILQYARKQTWYPEFYNALPLINGIKMKDGYISGVRSYAGYIKSKNGTDYTFSFIVNNFDGSPATVREKIWKLLDLLK